MKIESQNEPENPYLAYRKYFLAAGLVIGTIFTALYIYKLSIQPLEKPGLPADPWFKRIFFVVLIYFASFFQCSLLSKLFAWIMSRINSPK